MKARGRQALTVLLPVRAGRESAIAAAVANVDAALAERLRAVESLHFARLVLVPGAPSDGGETPACLLFETTYDGDFAAHVAELFVAAGAELGSVLVECDGVSEGGGYAELEAALRRGARQPRAFGAVNGGLGVKEIRHDAALRESASVHLERERPALAEQRPLQILVALRHALGLSAAPATSALRATTSEREAALLKLAAILPFVLRMLLHDAREHLLGLWHDRLQAARPATASGPLRRDSFPQRAFTHVSVVKPGRFRRAALRRALAFLSSLLGDGATEPGSLGVHSVRFVLLEDGRLLFTDQHDGSVASRLFALGRRVRALLALVWSSTEGFPPSLFRHLVGGTDHESLLEWLRTRELAPVFTYSAYPTLTVRDVLVNAEVRELLTAEPTDARARRLLELV